VTYWEAFEAYRCRDCRTNCINKFDDSATKARKCRLCHDVPALNEASETAISEGEGEPARPAAQRSEQPGPSAERPEAVAPARPTNLKDSVTPVEPGNAADSERELSTTAEWVSESYEKYPDRCALPLVARHGTSLRLEYTYDTWESWTSEVVDDADDEVSGQSLVERSAVTWGKAVEMMLESHEETRRTTVNLEKAAPGHPEYAEFHVDAVTRWFSSYQKNTMHRWKPGSAS